jgi:hypothetical protein
VVSDAGDDRVHIKGENRRVDVDFVRVEDPGVRRRRQEGFWQFRNAGEGMFVGARDERAQSSR